VRSTGNGGYSVTFSGYPTLNPSALTLNNLLPPPVPTYDSTIYRDSITEEVTE
ncbi:MAG: LD-carboxypeptidase, partial [Neisseria subflava]|nr:LD-carboxypeptidase [Neisseria subflava]